MNIQEQFNVIKQHNEAMKQLDLSIANNETLTNNQAKLIIENVLDTLTEVGNGTTDNMLYATLDYMFALRDLWYNRVIITPQM